MNREAQLAALRDLDEKSLRENVLLPLLARMGLKGVRIYHGPGERGKDIVCIDEDRLGNREYLAVVARAEDLNSNVSSPSSLPVVVHQVQQCFDVKYQDLFGMTSVSMDRVWIVTSRRIVPGAENSVYETLTKNNLSKLVRFISGEKLVDLIDEHYPEYWDASLESLDVLTVEKHRLVRFCREILLALGAMPSNVDEVLNQIIHSQFPPKVTSHADRKLTSASSYSVALDSISPGYAHDFFSYKRNYWPAEPPGLIRKLFFKAKEDIYGAMFDVDEILSDYEDVINKTDPWDLVKSFQGGLSGRYPFAYEHHGAGADAVHDINDLEDALCDIDELRGQLQAIDKLEWATSLVDSVANLEAELRAFFTNVEKESFTLFWRVETVEGRGCLRFLYDDESAPDATFSTTHTKTVELRGRGYVKGATRALRLEDIIEGIHHRIREYLDALLTPDGIEEARS